MARKNRAASSIKTSISAISSIHNLLFGSDPAKSFLIVRSLKGLDKLAKERSTLLPISKLLLASIISHLDLLDIPRFDRFAAKALFTLAYKGCFRIGELVISDSGQHSARIENFSIISTPSGKELKISLPSYKHHAAPALIVIKQSCHETCPILHLEKYLSIRPHRPGLLFINKYGIPYARPQVAELLKKVLRQLVPNPWRYNTHSFRIGRTSDLVSQGVPESILQQVGRWRSLAYRKYFRTQAFLMPE